MQRTLAQWLDYQEHITARAIELGLDRVRTVWQAMGKPQAGFALTVAGTNGKGSVVAYLEAMLLALGYRVGTYTSPHLLKYNERIRINGEMVDDDTLCAIFARIETARAQTPLSFYEYGTLAAFACFAEADVDIMLLEVGLGGRLDATNIIDADAVAITTIGLDHMEYLGPDRDSIGREKAGVARRGKLAVIGELDPPQGLLAQLAAIGADVCRRGHDYDLLPQRESLLWRHADGTQLTLPTLRMPAPCQTSNAATALAVLHGLQPRIDWRPDMLQQGLAQAVVPGRLQQIGQQPAQYVDVAHNPQSALELAHWLDARATRGKVYAVYGALADKDVAGVLQTIGTRVSHWFIAGLDAATPRGMNTRDLHAQFDTALPAASCSTAADLEQAWQQACAQATDDDLIIAFGSFFVVSAILGSISCHAPA